MAKNSSSSTESSSGGTALEEAVKVGYLGVVTDERDNEEYTVEGVTSAPDVTDDAYAQAKADEAKKAADQAVASIGGSTSSRSGSTSGSSS